MMISNYHTHTRYCDGKGTPEQLVQKAISLGCPAIGFSGHSFTFFDQSYCMSLESTEEYKADVRRLKEKYRGKIKIFLGVEQDYFSDMPTDEYDYIIGAVHYVKKDGLFLPVDGSEQKSVVTQYYDGDYYAFAEDYYELMADLYRKTRCNVVAHFDLVAKFNEQDTLFDTGCKRYRRAAEKALRALMKEPVAFEINNGAVTRGYRSEPYPAPFILDILKAEHKKIIYSSDCHDIEHLVYCPENKKGL